MKTKKKVVILGAGIAGLTTAWKLSKACDVMVLEKDKKVGGLSKTYKYKDFLFDFSAHRFGSDNPQVVDFFKHFIKKDLLICQKKTYINLWGKTLAYPPKPFEVAWAIPKKLIFPAVFDLLKASFSSTKKMSNFSDWARTKFGKTLAYHLNEKYAQKTWKTDPKFLSADWANSRVGVFDIKEFIVSMFFRKYLRNIFPLNHPDSEWFFYPKFGIGQLPQNIVNELKLSAKVLTNSRVIKIIKIYSGYEIVFQTGNKIKKIKADIVISTIPLSVLANVFLPQAPSKVVNAIKNLKYLSVITVNIMVKKNKLSDASWIYFPDDNASFNYIVEFKNWSRFMVKKNHTSLCATITCFEVDPIWNCDKKILIKKIINELDHLKVLNEKDVVDTFVIKMPYSYPILDINTRQNLDLARKHFNSKNFYLLGRTGNFEYINSDKVIEESLDLAQNILSGV